MCSVPSSLFFKDNIKKEKTLTTHTKAPNTICSKSKTLSSIPHQQPLCSFPFSTGDINPLHLSPLALHQAHFSISVSFKLCTTEQLLSNSSSTGGGMKLDITLKWEGRRGVEMAWRRRTRADMKTDSVRVSELHFACVWLELTWCSSSYGFGYVLQLIRHHRDQVLKVITRFSWIQIPETDLSGVMLIKMLIKISYVNSVLKQFELSGGLKSTRAGILTFLLV